MGRVEKSNFYTQQTIRDISPKNTLSRVFKIKKTQAMESPMLQTLPSTLPKTLSSWCKNNTRVAGLQDIQTQFWVEKQWLTLNTALQMVQIKSFPKNITKSTVQQFTILSSKVHYVWNKRDRWGPGGGDPRGQCHSFLWGVMGTARLKDLNKTPSPSVCVCVCM